MESSYTSYDNPLVTRYASQEMNENWSPQKKFSTWRRLWLALAQAQQQLGLDISDHQLEQMAAHLEDIDFEDAAEREKKLRHDVMSHVHSFGDQCPDAKPVIHLGATSCFVTDNTEIIQLRDGLQILRRKLVQLADSLTEFALNQKDQPTLGFTHFQPAQLTTVGKRASLWLFDFIMDLRDFETELKMLPFRGAKGTTGTQASFLSLFEGDHDKVKQLDYDVARRMGFEQTCPVTGQTYSRKIDARILDLLARAAESAGKMAGDLRLLAHLKEIEEPFGKNQVGSSAMAYKRNPMRCERVCALARFVRSLSQNASETHAVQWLERTLDDSANRRLSLPQAFLGVDAIFSVLKEVIEGCHVWPSVINRHIQEELPFMATESIIMAGVRAGGDRQQLHEAIRKHAMEASRRIKEEGAENDLVERIKADPLFADIRSEIDSLSQPEAFTGRASAQVAAFVENDVRPLLDSFNSEGDKEK